MKYKWALLSSAVCVSLAGCGGGGDDAAETPPPSIQPQGITAYAAYADPAGALCAQTGTDSLLNEYCVEPTSSSIPIQLLLSYLRDPSGKRVKFSLAGFDSTVDLEHRGYGGLSTKDVYIGAGRIHVDGRTYGDTVKTWSATPGLYSLTSGRDDQQLTLDVSNGLEEWVQINQADLTVRSASATAPTSIAFANWMALLGLRTDWSDAPKETTLYYQGHISITGGPGGKVTLPNGDLQERWATGQCQVDATFDVRGGDIEIKVSDCVGQDDHGTTQVSVEGGTARFFIKGSRIRKGLAPAAMSISNGDLDVASTMQITDIEGGVYGAQARLLHISGGNAGGGFQLVAGRVEK